MWSEGYRNGHSPRGLVLAIFAGALAVLVLCPRASGGPTTGIPDRLRLRDTLLSQHEMSAAAIRRSRYHDCGDLRVAIWNYGVVGEWWITRDAPLYWLIFPFKPSYTPAFRGEPISGNYYLNGLASLFGCVRGYDTLVSETSDEFLSYEPVRARSADPLSSEYASGAKAKQEYYVVCSDTLWNVYDEVEPQRYRAIGLEVHQSSYSWDASYSRRFVIVDAWFVNISGGPIEQGTVGIEVNPHIMKGRWNWDEVPLDDPDDICGFIQSLPGVVARIPDTMNLAWAASNDGDPNKSTGRFDILSTTGVLGIRPLRTPPGTCISFNRWGSVGSTSPWVWWSWGPSRQKTPPESFADPWGGGPVGDRNRYKRMTNGEIDYDSPYSAIDYSADGWYPPPQDESLRVWNARGADVMFLLSCGPLPPIAPGDSVSFTYAIVMGADFHTDPRNFADNFRPENPAPYLSRLDFTDLISNARWAEWIFDNPGVDTDSDGYKGPFHVVCAGDGSGCDTIYYRGDGIPDFRGPQPPVGPSCELTTRPHEIIVRWNGATTEYARDPLSRKTDWEGFRVYTSYTTEPDDFTLLASWDRKDFKRFSYRPQFNDWKQSSDPLTVAEWQAALLVPYFDPMQHPLPSFETAYRDSAVDTIRNVQQEIVDIVRHERISYFLPEDANNLNTYVSGGRTETNLIQRVAERDTVVNGKTCTYGVYELVLDNLLDSKPLYFSVTTFDWGDYARSVEPMESAIAAQAAFGFPLYSADVVVDSGLKVSVYPNPYKIRFKDAYGDWTNYVEQGYERPGKGTEEERNRRIWFINLPDTAEINIYSLDGDLIRKILHPDPFLTTYSSVVGWDLISRNTQAVTSGIYIWRVDSRLGKQVGKLVIIK
ncbi:MAG: hypothetical protein AB1792_04290 [Candidatus Zixiibacteriota bacterium]